MICANCSIESPPNLVLFRTVKEWLCPSCDTIHLFQHIASMPIGNYLYISEFTNNLDKLAIHYAENINHPMTITLCLPDGVDDIYGPYTGIYCDTGILSDIKLNSIHKTADAFIKSVHPTTQRIL